MEKKQCRKILICFNDKIILTFLKGWRPLRTIKFFSWDGEEQALIGSNEYVEVSINKFVVICMSLFY